HQLANVLEGAGLTNIPFLQGMSPIRASRLPDGDELQSGGMVFVSDKSKEKTMTLDELRVKDKATLSAEELQFITDHKDELSADERTKFGLEAAPVTPPTNTDTLSAEDRELLAAIKSGSKKVVDASAPDTTTLS